MKNWIILTVAVSVASSLFALLLSEVESKKLFRTLSGAVLMLVIFLPFSGMKDELSDIDFDNSYNDFSASFSENSKDVVYLAVKTGYENLINEKLMIYNEAIKEINAEIVFTDDEYELGKVEIILKQSIDNLTALEEEIKSITGTDCEVVFIEGF